MMKQILFTTTTFALLMLCSCSEKITQEQGSEVLIESIESHVVSSELAMKIASEVLPEEYNSLRSTKGLSQRKISNSFILEDYNKQPALHVINYEDGGFMIISGDDRFTPIQAYSDEGYFPEGEDNMPYGLMLWVEKMKATINYFNENDEIQDEVVKYEWARLSSRGGGVTKSVTPPEQGCEEHTQLVYLGPYLRTKWHQGTPYNEALPNITCNGETDHVSAGCVPIAIAQLAKYYECPTSYRWDDMPENSASEYTQNFILDLHNYLKADYALEYICGLGSGVPTSYNVANFFKNKLGYSNAFQISYSKESVKSRIEEGSPVIMRGDNHAWICDGYQEWEACADGNTAYYQRFHYNWGWRDTGSGWYVCNTFTVNNKQYDPDVVIWVKP